MPKYRHRLPQLDSDQLFLTDGGLETTLIFHQGVELPEFAAFHLLSDPDGYTRLRDYYRLYARLARDRGVGFILESPSWRSSPEWGRKLGYDGESLARANHRSVQLMLEVREELETPSSPMVISACVGPRGDGYQPDQTYSAEEFERYHAAQVTLFSQTEADFVSAFTMTTAAEATGIARAARAVDMPVVISFTVETDGRLPNGQGLQEAIEEVDGLTGGAPAYYMINCAHPTHFEAALRPRGWVERIRGLRANASTRSHAELNESTELDEGNPDELGRQHRELLARLPHLRVMGGCCGTDLRHVQAIAGACLG
ncbi:MAG: homocysteine methyltransferase [Candidatus Xenobia bacterium]